jgi:hypothetical protein
MSEGQTLESASVRIAVAAWSAILIGHLVTASVDLNAVLQRMPAPIVATGMAVVFLLVQLLMPHGGAAFVYFQF